MLSRSLLIRLIDLLLYGNLWIAMCAVALLWQSSLLLRGQAGWDALTGLVFFSTLFVYAAHRIVGMARVAPFAGGGRYRVFAAYRAHILAYALLALAGMGYYALQLAWPLRWALLWPALPALGYVLPILPGRRRLRDVAWLKIFLVAGVWAYVTVLLPWLAYGGPWQHLALALPARACFMFALTLPFDWRDRHVDAHEAVPTLPRRLGWPRTQRLALAALLLSGLLDSLWLPGGHWGLWLALALTALAIALTPRMAHDYFYSGLLDGLMIVQALLVWAALGG